MYHIVKFKEVLVDLALLPSRRFDLCCSEISRNHMWLVVSLDYGLLVNHESAIGYKTAKQEEQMDI